MGRIGPQVVPSTNSVVAKYKGLVATIGRAGLNSLFPNDFEAYICSLELVNSKDQVVDFFVFPIMPSSITQTEPSIVNIKKTAGGITTLDTTTFVPIPIVISGNFGRRFKFLTGNNQVSASAIRFSTQSGSYTKESILNGLTQIKNAVFSTTVKTGYGCIKILEAIVDKSRSLDEFNLPHRLYFYNPALGNNYLIKVNSLSLNQTKNENMIWGYTLNMTAIAPISGIRDGEGRNSLTKTTQFSLLNKGLNSTVNLVKTQLNAFG